jgi:hypothetical protein
VAGRAECRLHIGFSLRGVWALATDYALVDVVVYHQKFQGAGGTYGRRTKWAVPHD